LYTSFNFNPLPVSQNKCLTPTSVWYTTGKAIKNFAPSIAGGGKTDWTLLYTCSKLPPK
jgi:hypothetical protein